MLYPTIRKYYLPAPAFLLPHRMHFLIPMHLLPYHRLGESKNESLGKAMDLSIEVPSDEHMQRLKAIVESFGVECQIGG